MLHDPQTQSNFRHILRACSILWLLANVGLFPPSIFGQADSPIRGSVVMEDGNPIADVKVYGSVSKTCCPFKREETTTDKEGQFRLEHPGAVIHFWKENLQPRALVLRGGSSEVRITMVPPAGSLMVRACGKPAQGQKQIGWGKYGLQFEVQMSAVKILGGKPDVDYVKYVIKSKSGEAFLELWFGPYAMSTDPGDDMFIQSVKFEQRNVVTADGGVIGEDSWGEFASGKRWRQTAVVTQGGSIYQNASPQAADLFNQLVNSLCQVPSSNR